jgi:hypothetical protein
LYNYVFPSDRHFPNLRHLHLACPPIEILPSDQTSKLLKRLQHAVPAKQLETLHIVSLCTALEEKDEPKLLTSHLFGGLTSLEMQTNWGRTFVSRLLAATNHDLVHLILCDSNSKIEEDRLPLSEEEVAAMVKHWPNMQDFDITIKDQFRERSWSPRMVEACSAWKDLRLLHVQSELSALDNGEWHKALFANVHHWPQLRSLQVTTRRPLARLEMQALNKSCPHLTNISTMNPGMARNLSSAKSLPEKDICEFLQSHRRLTGFDAMWLAFGFGHPFHTRAALKQIVESNDGVWTVWDPAHEQVESNAVREDEFDIKEMVPLMTKCRDHLFRLGGHLAPAAPEVWTDFWHHTARLSRLERLRIRVDATDTSIVLTGDHLRAFGLSCHRLRVFSVHTDKLLERWTLPPLECSISDVLDLLYACPQMERLILDAQPLAELKESDVIKVFAYRSLNRERSNQGGRTHLTRGKVVVAWKDAFRLTPELMDDCGIMEQIGPLKKLPVRVMFLSI